MRSAAPLADVDALNLSRGRQLGSFPFETHTSDLIAVSRPVRMAVVGDESATFHFKATIVDAEG